MLISHLKFLKKHFLKVSDNFNHNEKIADHKIFMDENCEIGIVFQMTKTSFFHDKRVLKESNIRKKQFTLFQPVFETV